MARQKIQIKKIANKAARHVTFSKRRKGLLKKAQELSILCEADVALIIFSTTGKLFEFSSSSMKMILEKYIKSPNTIGKDGQWNFEIDNIDVRKLKQQMEDTSHVLSQIRGQNLEALSLKDLQLLEEKMEKGLFRVRSRKDKIMANEVDYLHKKEAQLHVENEKLRRQLNGRKNFHVEKNNTEESLFIGTSESQDHGQTSESMATAYRFNLNKASIHDSEPSDTSLQLRL